MMKYAVVTLLLCCAIVAHCQDRCEPNWFVCDNGCCFRDLYVCDGFDDCGDGSDERVEPDCTACNSSTHFRCDNGRCLLQSFTCNGIDDCGDDSDETIQPPERCPPCESYEFRCDNGKCINRDLKCNLENDCGDNSDETAELCPCNPGYFHCNNGRCIRENLVCNYENDCGDRSDEHLEYCFSCEAADYVVYCDNYGCVSKNVACDWKDDCLDWSDESAKACPCSDTEVRCPIPEGPPEYAPPRGICIPVDQWCDDDRIWDCPDGGDERNCDRPDDHLNVVKYREGLNLTMPKHIKEVGRKVPMYCPEK